MKIVNKIVTKTASLKNALLKALFSNLATFLDRLGALLKHLGALLVVSGGQKRALKSNSAQQVAAFEPSDDSGKLLGTSFDGIGSILDVFGLVFGNI